MSVSHSLWLTQPDSRVQPGMCYICKMSWDICIWWKNVSLKFYSVLLQILSSCPPVICTHWCCNKWIHRCSYCRNSAFYWMLPEFTASIIVLLSVLSFIQLWNITKAGLVLCLVTVVLKNYLILFFSTHSTLLGYNYGAFCQLTVPQNNSSDKLHDAQVRSISCNVSHMMDNW